jgi:hypothetical protein
MGLVGNTSMPVKSPVKRGTGDRIRFERIKIAALEFSAIML